MTRERSAAMLLPAMNPSTSSSSASYTIPHPNFPISGIATAHYQRPRNDDSLDALLAENLREPALTRIRAKIADSQRALMKRIDELTLERDTAHMQKLVLQQNYNFLSSYVQSLMNQQNTMSTEKLLLNQILYPAQSTATALGAGAQLGAVQTTSLGASSLTSALLDPSTTAFNQLLAQLLCQNSASSSSATALPSLLEKTKLFVPNGSIDPVAHLLNGSV